MKKRINKHIEKQDYVKVYIVDRDDLDLDNFSGIIYDQNEKQFRLLQLNSSFQGLARHD